MMFDLVAGARQERFPSGMRPSTARDTRVLVFDSGLGGLTVYPEVANVAVGAALVYAADDAVFPYGRLSEQALVARVLAVMQALVAAHEPDIVVIACHTASTLVLQPLRARWPGIAFVGTVPAIKPAAAISTSRMISVLATPGTVAREYTRDLIRAFASDCAVTLVGAARLASLAESIMRDHPVDRDAIAAEISPAFAEAHGKRTDVVVLGCTHFPLLLSHLEAVAPWPVTWIDPARAIARRVEQILAKGGSRPNAEAAASRPLAPALFTSNSRPAPALESFLRACGLGWESSEALRAVRVEEVGL